MERSRLGPRAELELVTRPTETLAWRLALVACLALALAPIWSARFPAMQDYPGQLFYTEVLRSHGDPASEYDRYYDFRFHPVYATFYAATLAFARVAPIETAGKLALSLYPILIAAVAARLARRMKDELAPWGALLLFAFAANQQWFYGNLNYLFSLPLLLLALLDFSAMLERPLGAAPIARHAMWQAALFVTHPMTYLVFVVFGATVALATMHRPGRSWRKLGVACAVSIPFILGLTFAGSGGGTAGAPSARGVDWIPPSSTLSFFALMFEGMQSPSNARAAPLAVWAAIVALLAIVVAAGRRRKALVLLPMEYAILLGLAILLMFVLPFRVGSFSYVNVRFSALVYFLLGLCAAHVRFGPRVGVGFASLVLLCLADSAGMQRRISAEVAEILPVAERIPAHARVLPLVFDPRSKELDSRWFGPHVQEYNYVPLIAGGGFNPYLFGSPLDPVRPKPGQERPAPPVGRPYEFRWELHASDYDEFLVLGAPPGLELYLELHADRRASSGKWTLFERRR